MRHMLCSFAAVAFFVSVLALTPDAAFASPLVAQGQVAMARVELVKKKKSEDSEDSGEKGWFDYLKMSFTFADDEVAEEVADGRIIEHILGGLFASFGGHFWAPMIGTKFSPPPVLFPSLSLSNRPAAFNRL